MAGGLSAVRRSPTESTALEGSDGTLLATAEAPCSGPAATADQVAPLPCADRRAAAFFELVSRWTSPDFATPAHPELAVRRLASAAGSALDAEESPRLQGWVLASLGALSALDSRAQALLARSPWPERVLATLRNPGSPLLHARALFAIGALYRELPPGDLPAAAKTQLQTGLASDDRFVRRQATLAAALSGEDELTFPILRTLGPLLGLPTATATSLPALLSALVRLPTRLPPSVTADLAPLLPPYVDLLLALAMPEATAAAEHLVEIAVHAEPLSATAYYLQAKVRDGRRDGSALPLLRQALSLGNLPAVFVAALGDTASALTAPLDLPASRRRLRQLVAHRPAPRLSPPPPTLTRAAWTRADAGQPQLPQISPSALEQQALRTLADHGADSEAARSLGRELFRFYPFASHEYYSPCLHSFLDPDGNNRDLLDQLGLGLSRQASGRPEVIGVVAVAEPAEAVAPSALGVTCALCHTQVDAHGERQDGLPSRTYDQGLLLAACIDQPIFHKSQNRNLDQLLQYGPGRNDSTADGVHDPTEIPSLFALRPGFAVRWNGDLPTLELQIDRNLSQRSAPPAVVALVAAYLRSLGPAWAARTRGAGPSAGQPSSAGAAIFERECARCHAPPLFSHGQVVPLSRLGTDPRRVSAVLPNSSPGYKVPSLLALSRTAPYLHDGSVPTMQAMLDPRRAGGHRFGLDLSASERAALIAFLREL